MQCNTAASISVREVLLSAYSVVSSVFCSGKRANSGCIERDHLAHKAQLLLFVHVDTGKRVLLGPDRLTDLADVWHRLIEVIRRDVEAGLLPGREVVAIGAALDELRHKLRDQISARLRIETGKRLRDSAAPMLRLGDLAQDIRPHLQ